MRSHLTSISAFYTRRCNTIPSILNAARGCQPWRPADFLSHERRVAAHSSSRVSKGTDRAAPQACPAAGFTVPRELRPLWQGVQPGSRGPVGQVGGQRAPGGIARPGGCGGRACAPAPGEAEAAEGDPALGDRRGGGAGPGPAAPGAARSVSSPVAFFRSGREESPVRPAAPPPCPWPAPGGGGDPRRGAVARVPLPPPPTPPRGRSEQEAAGRQKRTKEAKGVFRCRGRDAWALLCTRRSRGAPERARKARSAPGCRVLGCPPPLPGSCFVPLPSACRRSPGCRVVAEYLFQRIYF